jgi:hypothetical protein
VILLLAPVVVFVYNRPNHTKQTIESLAENFLAKETEVFIFSDSAKNEKSFEKVDEVRKYIDSLLDRKLFKSIEIIKADSNKGLANSVILGVSQIINKYNKVIVVEDDLVSSKDYLQYMNDGLNYYEKDKKIWSISGYSFNLKIPKEYKSEIYLSYRACSWGYATWKDRWEHVDWKVTDYGEFKNNKKSRKKFDRGGRDMADMLDSQMQGKIDSWAIRWCYAQSKLDMFTVYPVVSRIKNIGLDGTGTHSGINSHYNSIMNNEFKKCNFNDPGLNNEILKNFKNYFMTPVWYMLSQSKKIVKKIVRM